MKIQRRIMLGVAAVSVAFSSPTSAQFRKQAEKEAREQALTPSAVQQTILMKDDDFETSATLETSKAFTYRGDFFERVRADNLLRAFISKGSGQTKYQLYQSIMYTGNRRNYDVVSYQSPDGLQSTELRRIDSQLDSCGAGLCVYTEIVGFDVSESFLRQIAKTYQPGNSPLWRFKFKARSGDDWVDDISPAEVAGLLAAVDAYKVAHKLN